MGFGRFCNVRRTLIHANDLEPEYVISYGYAKSIWVAKLLEYFVVFSIVIMSRLPR